MEIPTGGTVGLAIKAWGWGPARAKNIELRRLNKGQRGRGSGVRNRQKSD